LCLGNRVPAGAGLGSLLIPATRSPPAPPGLWSPIPHLHLWKAGRGRSRPSLLPPFSKSSSLLISRCQNLRPTLGEAPDSSCHMPLIWNTISPSSYKACSFMSSATLLKCHLQGGPFPAILRLHSCHPLTLTLPQLSCPALCYTLLCVHEFVCSSSLDENPSGSLLCSVLCTEPVALPTVVGTW
jgi:hypothetical protein